MSVITSSVVNAVPNVGDELVLAILAIASVGTKNIGVRSPTTPGARSIGSRRRAHLNLRITINPHGEVSRKRIWVCSIPPHLVASTCKIAVDRVGGAILNQINLARPGSPIPVIWGDPQGRGPRATTILFDDIKIHLMNVMQIKFAVRHAGDETFGCSQSGLEDNGCGVTGAHPGGVDCLWRHARKPRSSNLTRPHPVWRWINDAASRAQIVAAWGGLRLWLRPRRLRLRLRTGSSATF